MKGERTMANEKTEDAVTAVAPKSGESSGISEGQQKRRRRRRPKDTSGNVGYEDGPTGENDKKGKSKTTRKRANITSAPRSGEVIRSERGSLLFTILLIGILFCVIDVVYIIGFVDRQLLANPGLETDPFSASREEPGGGEISIKNPVSIHAAHNALPKKNGSDGGDVGDKGPLISLLTKAGFRLEDDATLIDDLPTWSEVVGMYGEKPVVYGLKQCDKFQHQSDPALHFLGVAGTFNSGTNLLAELLIANCHMQARMDKFGAKNRGIRWQVPWGKHTPPGDEEFRQGHKTKKDGNVDTNNILAAVTVRDPLTWLGSMCRHTYTAHFPHSSTHCPDFSFSDLATTVKYNGFYRHHESIIHMWNSFYTEYKEADFPRLLVRYEDLIFHPEVVTKTVCECAGGSMRKDGRFKYIVDSAKKGVGAHGKVRTGYADALVKYGSEKRRYQNYKVASDLEYIRDHVDKTLMQTLHYPDIDPSRATNAKH